MGATFVRRIATFPNLLALAAVLLALSLGGARGIPDTTSLIGVSLAIAVCCAAVRVARRPWADAWPPAPNAILASGLGWSLCRHLAALPTAKLDLVRLLQFRAGVIACALLLVAGAWTGMPVALRRARRLLFGALVAGLGALVLAATPEPFIDVWHFLQLGSESLLTGRSPYDRLYPNLYADRDVEFLDPSLLSPDGRFVTSNPYSPMLMLWASPAAALGDVRWTNLAALLLCAGLILRLGGASTRAELAAALLLLQPQGFYLLAFSWTEPLVLASLLLVALALQRCRVRPDAPVWGRLPGWALAALLAALALTTKQYLPLLLLPLLFVVPPPVRLRALSVALLGAALLLLPFALWDADGLYRSLVEFQLRQPFRPDALSWPAEIVSRGGPRLPVWPAFALAALALAYGTDRRGDLAQALLAAAFAWLVFVVFNKQAFLNYYWLGVGLLCAALAALPAAPDGAAEFPREHRASGLRGRPP